MLFGGRMAIKAKGHELTASDAAVVLGISYQRVIYLVQTKRLQGSRRGGHWYVKIAAVAKERTRAAR